MKIIIIGGVAGGATTAARIRRTNETAEIILLEKGKYISYANCGLPYYIGGVIEEREKLFVQTPEAFSTRFRVDVRTENEVIFIDRKRKTVTVRQSSEDSYEESYDKLLISTGASPVRPPLPGIDLNGIFTLRNVTDTDRIKEYINSHAPRKAVVIGAGFIGLEMAENLHAQGAKVSIVEMGNQVMAPIDFSMASLVHQHLMDKGVNLYLEQAVASFERDGKELKVIFKNGESISADIVILSIGVRPETTLARAAELTSAKQEELPSTTICKLRTNRFTPSVTQSNSAIRSPENRGSITLLVPPIVRDELSQTTFREHTSLMKEPSELPLQKYST